MRLLFTLPALAALALMLALPAAGGPAKAPGFTGPTTLPGSDSGSEPSLAISTTGVRYASWQSPGEFASSPDGVRFTNLGPPDRGALGDVSNAVDAAGALYNAQICGAPAALHTCVYRSVDGGNTWPQQTIAADVNPGASDRPWIDVYPKNTGGAWNPDLTTVYLEYHTFSPDDLAYVPVSHDGGKTFSPPHLITTDTNAISGSGCNTIPSGVVADPRSGAVYALWLSGNDVASNLATGCNYSQIGPFNKAWVSTSTDGGTTWTAHLAWQGAFDQTTKIGDNADKIFSTITVDSGHQVHIALSVRHNDDPVGFVTQCQVNQGNCQETPQRTDLYLVTSPDGGQHWTQPFQVNKTAGSFFFPWLSAGSTGIVDGAYYSSSTLQPNNPASVWYVGFSQITGAVATYTRGAHAAYTSTPVATDEVLLDPNPIHGDGTTGGGVCTFGIFCSAVPGANRGLADVFEVHVDPAGGANVTWTKDTGGRAIGFACQSSGASVFAGAPDLSGCYGPADLSVTNADSPDPVLQGQDLTYHLTVTNNGTPSGPSTTSGVKLVDTLPAGVTFVSATPTVARAADMSITKTDSPDPAHVGKTLTYTIRVANAGPSPATAVTVKDTLPSSEDFRSIKTTQGKCARSGQAITCSLGTVSAGGAATITLVVKPKTVGTVLN